MPVTRGRQGMAPVIVERKPDYATNDAHNIAPTTPSPPGSPKAVRFAPKLTSSSRPLTSTEAWSLWHFEDHARRCPQCNHPQAIARSGGRLCEHGHALAQDVAIHVYYKAGEIYSTEKDNHKHVRVEIPPNYDRVRDLLKAMDRHLRSATRNVPIISYDPTYPVSPRRTPPRDEVWEHVEDRREVVIEPSDSQRHHPSKRKTKPKSKGYQPTVVREYVADAEAVRDARPREGRGSLYHSDRQRKAKDYHVVVREPERRKDDDRRYVEVRS